MPNRTMINEINILHECHCSDFTRIAAKVSALTVLQYVNYVNHRKIGQVKYALI